MVYFEENGPCIRYGRSLDGTRANKYMNEIQVASMRKFLEGIADYCEENEVLPIVVLGLTEEHQEIKFWQAAEYPPGHLKKMLQFFLDNFPE
jgi:hypothetical protein